MSLKDIRQSASEMPDEELLKLVLNVRDSRRTKKITVRQKSAKQKAAVNVDRLICSMSVQELQLLSKRLEGITKEKTK